jgi:feruloyl esterase
MTIVGRPIDGMWAMNDPQLRIDSGYRSEHALSIAAKAVIEIYYGQRPSYSYFAGCSNGGRQALMEAQRYPDDFDGIIAGAPGNNLTALAGEFFPWIAQANTDKAGRQILRAEKLQLLHTKVLAACDATDGLVDGLLTDPRTCTFDPATIRCPGTSDGPDCLTAAQVDTVHKIYQGPVDDHGRRLFPDGLPRGTELAWLGYVVAAEGQGMSGLAALGLNYLKYFSSWENPPASFTLADHRFDQRTFTKLRQMSGIYDATDPDLTKFRNSGGKLIIWHGWSDPAIPATSSIAYYHAVTERMGGLRNTQKFARLYLLPGVYTAPAATVRTPSTCSPPSTTGSNTERRQNASSPRRRTATKPSAPARCSRTRCSPSTTAPEASTTRPTSSASCHRSPPTTPTHGQANSAPTTEKPATGKARSSYASAHPDIGC